MEKTEPTFVPEWLKNSGGLNATSSLHAGEQGSSKLLRNKSLEKDLGRVSLSDRTTTTTSSYFRRTSINNGSGCLRSYSSFNRNHRDRDWDKDISEFRHKEKLENRHREYSDSDSLGNILPSRCEKDCLRRSRSSVGKRGESWSRKGASELTMVNRSSHINGGGSLLSGNVKRAFERDFPSLGADEKQVDSDVGRVPPGLSLVINSLPVGNSSMIGGDGWTSALAEVPVIVSNNNGNGSSGLPVQPVSVSATTDGWNMVETLAHDPPRTQTAPKLTVGTQRLEELAVKQSRQLIPMTPLMPKALDKPKLKIGQSHLITTNPHTPQSAAVKPDVSKTSTMGKLHVLKPSRERNGISPTAKDSLSPTSGSKLPNSPHAGPSAVAPAPPSKPGVLVLEKRPSSQAQSRSNFFNLMRKKSMASSSSTGESPVVPQGGLGSTVVQQSSETKVNLTCNGDAVHNQSGPDAIPEEEEARLLRLMGWEESAEVECLTDEEIRSFYQHLLKVKPTSKGVQPKLLMPTSSSSKVDF